MISDEEERRRRGLMQTNIAKSTKKESSKYGWIEELFFQEIYY